MLHGDTVLTTVTAPASSTLLCSRERFKRELAITGRGDDDYIDDLLAQASAAVQRYCNRAFVVETVLDEFWPARDPYPWQVSGGVARLQLSRWPVVAIASVVLDVTPLVAGADYRVDGPSGQVVRLDPSGRPRAWSAAYAAITYTAGFSDIPADLQDAVTRMMRARWFARLRDPLLRSETIPGVSEGSYFFAAGPDAVSGLPPDVAAILDGYRVPVTA